MSLLVILVTQSLLSADDFRAWAGACHSSFRSAAGDLGVDPAAAFGEPGLPEDESRGHPFQGAADRGVRQWKNAKVAILALIGLVAGQAVVWYSGQFYALFFLTAVLKVDAFTGNLLVAWSLLIGCGGFILFGCCPTRLAQADHPRRLHHRRADLLPGVPVHGRHRNPALSKANETVKVVVIADPADCSFQFNPTGLSKFTNSCDIAKGHCHGPRWSTRSRMRHPAPRPASRSPTRHSIRAHPPSPRPGRHPHRRRLPGRVQPVRRQDGASLDIFRAQPFTLC